MAEILGGLRLFVIVMAMTLLGFFGQCAGASAADLAKGLAWLQAQAQSDGSLTGERTSIATPLQARSEAIFALGQLAAVPGALAGAVSATATDNTEYLARQAIVMAKSGQSANSGVAAILSALNADGGFGGDVGFASNPLDTAWALLALKVNNVTTGTAAALAYLQNVQRADGSYSANNASDVYATALVVQALAAYAGGNGAIGPSIQAAVTWLSGQQGANGDWNGSVFQSAEAYLALHDFASLSIGTGLTTYLAAAQQADGSWGADPFATALALRALALAGTAPANPTLSILRGKVIDAQTGLPLAGVTAALSGMATLSLTTQADGVFQFRDVAPGQYTVQLSLANYGSITVNTLTLTGATQDLGILRMTKVAGATTGTVEGRITDAGSGAALAGAMVVVGGLSAISDANGNYQIGNVPAGPTSVTISMSGHASASGNGTLAAGGVLVFSPALSTASGAATGGTLQGIATSAASGVPLAGVSISVTGANTAAAVTDAQGKYAITGLTAGAVTLSASHAGYDTVAAMATVYVSNTITFSPEMYVAGTTPAGANTAGVSGIVLDAGNGTPLAGVAIQASYGNTVKTLQSGADGRFSLSGISTVSVTLGFSLAGYQATSVTIVVDPLATIDIGQIRLRQAKAASLLPDLTVATASRQGAVTGQQTLRVAGVISATIANQGSATAPSGVQVLAFVDVNKNGSYDPGIDTLLGQSATSTAIANGGQLQLQVPVQGALPFRDAPISVWADSSQSVAELNEGNNIGSTAMATVSAPSGTSTIDPVLKWQWTGGSSITTPIVGPLVDSNGDGGIDQNDVPAVVVVKALGIDYAPGILTALSGKDGHVLWSVTDPTLYTGSETTPAIADIDGDGKAEILMYLHSGGMAAINNDGTLKWKSVYPPSTNWYNYGAPTIADLDGDGKGEIVARNYVLNRDGTLRFQLNETVGHLVIPTVADLDGDGKPEIVIGPSAYHADGTLYWRNNLHVNTNLMLTAIGDFDGSGRPQIVLDVPGAVYLLNHDGSVKWGPVRVNSYNGGAPTIGDVDGDGVPEIGISGPAYYTVLNADGSIRWQANIQEASATCSASMFDFDGSGKAKIVHLDENKFRIFDGNSGKVLYSNANYSATASEYPVVADVDGSGHAAILVPQNSGGNAGLRVYQDRNNNWAPAPRIWNEYNYHITNINPDGSIPKVERDSWRVHNSYRQNKLFSIAKADLTASYIRVQDMGGTQPSGFTARIGNGGGLTVPAGISIAFYSGAPQAGGTLLGTARTTAALNSGDFQDVALNYPGALTGITLLTIVADDDGSGKSAIDDFDHGNNTATLALSALPGSFLIQLVTDQSAYGPGAPVALTATVTNAGSYDGQATVRFTIETGDGSAVIATLGTVTVLVPKAAHAPAPAAWNTGSTYSGNYLAKAELVDAQGNPYAAATAAFTIGTGLSSSVASADIKVDKASYRPTDTVKLTDRINNLTQNQILDNLTATTTVTRPDGSIHWTQTAAIAQLVPTGSREINYNLNLATAPEGAYRATLTVKDAAGAELARAETAFGLTAAHAVNGLQGTVSAAPKQITTGQAVTIAHTVSNSGGTEFRNLPITISIIDPDRQTVLDSRQLTIDLAPGQTRQLTQTWTLGAGRPGTTYLAVQTASVEGATVTLGADSFALAADAQAIPALSPATLALLALILLLLGLGQARKKRAPGQ